MSSEVDSSFLDTTLSSVSDGNRAATAKAKGGTTSSVSRAALERRQMLHNIELLKLSVNLKENQLKELKSAHSLQVEELDEKLADVSHQRQVLRARLQYCSQTQSDEAALHQRRVTSLEASKQELGEERSRLQDQLSELTAVCDRPLLTASEFQALKRRPVERLVPCELLKVALYESVVPVLRERDDLMRKIDEALQQAARSQEDADRQSTLCQREADNRLKAQTLCTELQQQLEEQLLTKMTEEKERDVRVLNYDSVLKERDEATQRCQRLQREFDLHELQVAKAAADISELMEKASAAERRIELLEHDKAYLTQQVETGRQQQHFAEDRLEEVRQQLNTANRTLEKAQAATATEREDRRKEWKDRLAQELTSIKAQTSDEIQRIRVQSAEAVERETRLLKEALERCQLERDNASRLHQDVASKHQALSLEFQRLESTSHNQLSECQHELQLRVFELERLKLLHTDCANKEESAKLDAMKSSKQLEVLKEELHVVRRETDRRAVELEMQCRSYQERLSSYDSLEKELEETLVEAAHDRDEENVGEDGQFPTASTLLSKWSPPSVTSAGQFMASRHWQNRLSVARKLLQSDKECSLLRRKLAEEKEEVTRLSQELEGTKRLLQQTSQPITTLLQEVQARNEDLRQRDGLLARTRAELGSLQAERKQLLVEKTALLTDLERLLQQQENVTELRQAFHHLQVDQHEGRQRSKGPSKKLIDPLVKEKKSSSHKGQEHRSPLAVTRATATAPTAVYQQFLQPHDHIAMPTPTVFTKPAKSRKKKKEQAVT